MTSPVAFENEMRRRRMLRCQSFVRALLAGSKSLPAGLRVDTSAVERLLATEVRP